MLFRRLLVALIGGLITAAFLTVSGVGSAILTQNSNLIIGSVKLTLTIVVCGIYGAKIATTQ